MSRHLPAAMHLSVVVLLGLAVLPLAACDDHDDEATAICVDHAGNRVDDSQCHQDYDHNDGMSPFEWYFIMSTLNQPAVGTQVVHNTYYNNPAVNRYAGFKPPATVAVAKGVPKTGWKPSDGSKSFVPKDKTNLTPPKVIQQQNKPMYQQKPANNPAPRPAPAPRIKVGK